MMSSVIWLTSFDTFASILSTLPLASPGMLNFGFLVRMYSRLGLMIFIVYGPAPGGGLAVRSLKGVLLAGVGAADGSPPPNRRRLPRREQQAAVGLVERDLDLAGLVVVHDARQRGALLLRRHVLVGAHDV